MTNLIPINIAISAGHSNVSGRDRGAASGKLIEGVLAANLRKLMIEEFNKRGYSVMADGDDTVLKDSLSFFRGKTNSKTIVLDIHFNAATPAAKGTETLIPTNYVADEVTVAYGLSDIVHRILGTPRRGNSAGKSGVKTELDSHHGKLGWMTLDGINVLMEVEFITNPKAMEKYIACEKELATALVDYLLEQSCRILNAQPAPDTAKTYTVKSGDSLSKIAASNKTSVDKLQKLNNITAPSKIRVGQIIKLS